MKTITKIITLSAISLFNISTFADGNLTHLKVDADIVYFATDEAKTVTSPSCMASENSDKWSVSLNSATGKAIYALLVTAVADKRKVVIASANDCADAVGVERAQSVELGMAQELASAMPVTSLWKEVAIATDVKGAYGRKCTIVLNSQKNGADYLTREIYHHYRDPSTEYSNCICNNGSTNVLKASTSSTNTISCLVSINE